MSKITPEQTQANIQLVHSLVEQGLSRRAIVEQTGLKERFVRDNMAGVIKGSALVSPAKTVKPNNLNKAAQQAYALAIRPQGCKDFELRTIAFNVYGREYSSNHLYSIRQRVQLLAEGTDNRPVFVPDWVCDEAPEASRIALEQIALDLQDILNEKLDQFMDQFSTGADDDQLESTEAQRKQAYAARSHILKLAIADYSPEPTAALLARSKAATDALEGCEDIPLSVITGSTLVAQEEAPQAEAASLDAFFDQVVKNSTEATVEASNDDPFSTVGIISASELKDRVKANEAHITYLEELLTDDVNNDLYIDTDSDNVYNLPSGFNINKYLTGGSNAHRTGVKWCPEEEHDFS